MKTIKDEYGDRLKESEQFMYGNFTDKMAFPGQVTHGLSPQKISTVYGTTHSTVDEALDYVKDRALAKEYHPVERPEHYNRKGIECIQAIEAALTEEEFKGYLKGNCIKYEWRHNYKGMPVEDLKKAKWYLEKLIKVVEDGQRNKAKTSEESKKGCATPR